MVCAHCRQGISGQFLRVGRLAYHPEHFLCAACQLPIKGSFQTHQNRALHPACYQERFAPRCAQCSKPIDGKYVVLDRNKNLHQACAKAYMEAHNPPCAQCGKALLERFKAQHPKAAELIDQADAKADAWWRRVVSFVRR